MGEQSRLDRCWSQYNHQECSRKTLLVATNRNPLKITHTQNPQQVIVKIQSFDRIPEQKAKFYWTSNELTFVSGKMLETKVATLHFAFMLVGPLLFSVAQLSLPLSYPLPSLFKFHMTHHDCWLQLFLITSHFSHPVPLSLFTNSERETKSFSPGMLGASCHLWIGCFEVRCLFFWGAS